MSWGIYPLMYHLVFRRYATVRSACENILKAYSDEMKDIFKPWEKSKPI